jgi:hypothetical protein
MSNTLSRSERRLTATTVSARSPAFNRSSVTSLPLKRLPFFANSGSRDPRFSQGILIAAFLPTLRLPFSANSGS